MERIPYTKPSITKLEISYANDAATNGWGKDCYLYIKRFEDKFKNHLGSKYAIATSSCTGALHMGMAALNIGPGDEVIMADTNWIATASPIMQLGAKPIFIDILTDSWCIDPKKIEAAISPRTKAIIAVHLYGNLCDMDHLNKIGNKYGIPIIEDAAEAIGSFYGNKRAGSIGRFGTFSFHGTKTITTGEGGMFVTNDKDLYNRVLTFSNHGRASDQIKQFWSDEIGFKYKISNIQAAIGCAQVERIEKLVNKKRKIFRKYLNSFSDLQGVKMNPEPKGTINGAWMPTIVFDHDTGITREKLQKAFEYENIDARVFFWPLSSMPMFEKKEENINSYDICKRAINLPSYHKLAIKDQERIIKVIKKMFN